MNHYIKSIEVVGLHHRFDMRMDFSEGVNIVYGVNGAGKTTLLHILANAANFDLERFTTLAFHSISMKVSDGSEMVISAEPSQDQTYLERVTVRLDGREVVTLQHKEAHAERDERRWDSEIRRIEDWKRHVKVPLEVTYFPAFRTMSEAWSSLDFSELFQSGVLRRRFFPPEVRRQLMRHRELGIAEGWQEYEVQTTLAREIFGQFVPQIRYPSPREIQRDLDGEIRRAQNRLAAGDQSLLSETFQLVFAAISRGESDDLNDTRAPDQIRDRIGKQLDQLQDLQSEYGLRDIYSDFDALRSELESPSDLTQEPDSTTTRVLRVYEYVLRERKSNLLGAFDTVRAYINAVNRFFNEKRLITALTDEDDVAPRLQIKHDDRTRSEFDTLSSGERQVAGLIYSASRMAQGNVVLVDEPELSLHIDWQRAIIKAMVEQLPSKQLIVCTHSPVIGAEYGDEMKELVAQPTLFKSTRAAEMPDNLEDWVEIDYSEDIV